MQFDIDDTKFMPPSTAAVLCREGLGIQIATDILDHINPMFAIMGKPRKPSAERSKTEVVVQVQFGHYRDVAVRLNETAKAVPQREKVMADTIRNLNAKLERLEEESSKRSEALASALQFIERIQCRK